jgi:hypothetical protein
MDGRVQRKHLLVPETTGKSLDEVQILGGSLKTDSICLVMLWAGQVHYDRGSIPRSMVVRSGKADKSVRIRFSFLVL